MRAPKLVEVYDEKGIYLGLDIDTQGGTVKDSELVNQKLHVRLKRWKGEWKFVGEETDDGVDWIKQMSATTTDQERITEIRQVALNTDDVINASVSLEQDGHKLKYTVEYEDIYGSTGSVEVES